MSAPSSNVSSAQAGIESFPRRRQNAVQPPSLLTTSLGNARNTGLGIGGIANTPISTTSLSSPFSTYTQSLYPASPGAAMRGTSPMTAQSQTGFSGVYNPQHWGPVNTGSPNLSSTTEDGGQSARSSRPTTLAPQPAGPDEPVASPPPPYSPRRNQDSQDSPHHPSDGVSSSDAVSSENESSHYGIPLSAATTVSPSSSSRYPQGRSPLLRYQATQSDSPNASTTPSFPPPPGPGQRFRSASKNHADRLLSSFTSKGKGTSGEYPVNAIDALQSHTARLLAQTPDVGYANELPRAPAARRAASTGCIGVVAESSRSHSQSASPVTWEPGVPLPPPPPGPPPGPPPKSVRSQSLNRSMESPVTGLAPNLAIRSRRPPGTGTSLDTVPPTPADWREDDAVSEVQNVNTRTKAASSLHIDTGSIVRRGGSYADTTQMEAATNSSHIRRDSSTGGLFRSPAVRNRSAKGIRERRSESRNGRGRAVGESAIEAPTSIAPWQEDHESMKPSNLVLQAPPSNAAGHRMLLRSTPKSGKSMQSLDEALSSAEPRATSGKAVSFASSHTTPQPMSGGSQHYSTSASTPPFSPGRDGFFSPKQTMHASPALPLSSMTSPLQRSTDPRKTLSLIVPRGPDQRPVSHLLHIPNSNDSMQVPLTPSTPATKTKRQSLTDLLGPESPKAFAARAIERHRLFAEREAAAANDTERLDLFVQFMTAESRIRRDQYASVFDEEGIDVSDLTAGLFGRPITGKTLREMHENLPSRDTSKRTSIASSALGDSSSQDDSSAISRKHESPSSATTDSSGHHRIESNWLKDYVPSLSPIASMSIVTGQDEMDSRGRTPSRWWEDTSHSGDLAQGDAFKVLERSKRESKYMGVPREARSSPSYYESGVPASNDSGYRQPAELGDQLSHGHDQYPTEKVGWHEEASSNPTASNLPPTPASAPFTPDPRRLDISRLYMLPPPFPRHHPAVNNNHPDLADIRAVVRSLQKKEEAEHIKESYRSQIQSQRQRASSWCQHQQSLHTQDIEYRIEHGEMTPESFEEAELGLEVKLNKSDKEITQADFDLFQNSVLSPLHALFSDRINLATDSLHKLSSRLFSDAESQNPNLAQEEGDEEPELLEKLTQLKWLFEARESLHRQIYDLLSERNSLYKAIVLLPYKQAKNHSKYTEAEDFFTKDAEGRKFAFEQEVCSRAQACLNIIESNVSRGVEVQLSAFWDIAPSLLELLHKVPHNLDEFEVYVPAKEYEENPSYFAHPLQYLYSLLSHAEKSTYQFIESQVNLLCLLHEIRSHALAARCRVDAHEEGSELAAGEKQTKEERQLTEDLKSQVAVIEGQWQDALGGELMEVRERVREALLEKGGWNDEVEEV